MFLEDVGEISYKIQRCLMQLYNGGFLSKIRAIIFCQFTNSDQYLERTIQDFVNEYCRIPAFRFDFIGHGEINLPLILGTNAKIIGENLIVENSFEMAWL